MNVESYRRRVRRYEFGKQALLLVAGAIAFSLAVFGMTAVFSLSSVGGGLAILVSLFLFFVVAPVLLVYAAFLYVVLRRSKLDTADIVRYDLTKAATAFERAEIDRVLVLLEDVRWTLTNHQSKTIPKAVKKELLAYINALDDETDRRAVIESTFEQFYASALTNVGGSIEDDVHSTGSDRTDSEVDRVPTPETTTDDTRSDDDDGALTEPESHDGTAGEVKAKVDTPVDDTIRHRVHRFAKAKRGLVRLLVGFVLLFILYTITFWEPLLLVLVLLILLIPLLLLYTVSLYIVLRLSGVDSEAVDFFDLPTASSVFAIGEFSTLREGVHQNGQRGAIGNTVAASLDILDDGRAAVESTWQWLYRTLQARLFVRGAGDAGDSDDTQRVGIEDIHVNDGDAHEEADRAVAQLAEFDSAETPDGESESTDSSTESVPSETSQSAPTAVGTTPTPSRPRIGGHRLPISSFWMVIGGAFTVGLPIAFSGNTELGFGLIGTILTAYSLKHQIGQ